MIFNKHLRVPGSHAFLSPSSNSWLNYDDEKLDRAFLQSQAAQRGVELHAFAHEAIRLGVRLPDTKKAINMYVNDAIGYRMNCEQFLFYSENAYGTADTIAFRNNLLRIHDLKTGRSETSVRQLHIYAALFCLEYDKSPLEIQMDLRIYQGNEARMYETSPHDIFNVMDKITVFDKRIRAIRLEAMS